MIRSANVPCDTCGTTKLFGTSVDAYCPTCEKAYHSLEVRYEAGEQVSFEYVIQAMNEDATIRVAFVKDWTVLLELTEQGKTV